MGNQVGWSGLIMSEKTQRGLEYLEDVILDVLRKAENYGKSPLNAGDITRCAGIPFEHETGSGAPYKAIQDSECEWDISDYNSNM